MLVSLAPTLVHSQSNDPRLAVAVTLRERYMTLGELGALVADKAKVHVSVDPAISERKVSLFCEDKPLGQIVQKVTETLFLEWSGENGEYQLRLSKAVAREERSILTKQNLLAVLELRHSIQNLIDLTQYTPEQLAEEVDPLSKSLGDLSRDSTRDGEKRYQEASRRLRLIQPLSYTRIRWDIGYALAKFSPDDLAQLERGGQLYASTRSLPGAVQLLPEAFTKNPIFANPGQVNDPAGFVLITLRYDASNKQFTANYRSKTTSIADSDLMGSWHADLSKEPLVLRLATWSHWADKDILDTPLNRKASLPEADSDGAWTLADHLEWLHDRSGIPIVADAYRHFAGFSESSTASTVREWIRQFAGYNPERQTEWAMFSTDQGWLMAKDRQYWERLAGEVPERYIRPLEAKVSKKQSLWIDDYMQYARIFTPSQEEALADRIVHFPVQPLIGRVSLLKLWDVCGESARKRAAHGGLSLAAMGTKIQSYYYQVLSDEALNGLMDPNLIVNFLPGGPALPPDMCLFYEDTRMPDVEVLGQPLMPLHTRMSQGYEAKSTRMAGANFTFGTPNGPKATKNVQISELAKAPS